LNNTQSIFIISFEGTYYCISKKGSHGRDRMVVGFTTTCSISAYSH